jgi:hypothetical protein
VTTWTAQRSSTKPQFLLAVVAAVGISFIVGEKVGVRLATAGAAHRATASEVATARPQAEAAGPVVAGPAGSEAAEVAETPGIGPDCNTNYR